VRAAILKTIDNFLIDAGSRLQPYQCPLDDVGQRNAIRLMARDNIKRLIDFQKHDLPITHDTYLKVFELRHRIDDGYE